MAEYRLKAFNGDRKANLLAIAAKLEEHARALSLSQSPSLYAMGREMSGLAIQLSIIANEWKPDNTESFDPIALGM